MRGPLTFAPGHHLDAQVMGPVTITDFVRFAGASGDFNPLHHDQGFARRAGFDDVIAMGQFQAAVMAGWLTDQVGVENLREFEVRYRLPVAAGMTLRLSGSVQAVRTDPETNENRATIVLELADADGVPLTSGAALVAVA